ACLPRVCVVSRSVIRIINSSEIQGAGLADQVEQVVGGIAFGAMSELIRKSLHREAMIYIRHRAQPSDANMGLRRTVLDAKVRNVVRHIGPALRQMGRIPV